MSKIYDAIMGFAVGDALGVPAEFKKRDTFHISGMTGFGTHNQPAGTWSDDTSMTLATMESIARTGGIEPEDIMHNFSEWMINNKFTPHGKVFDYGASTYRAIMRYVGGTKAEYCGDTDFECNGNGALMRILPLAVIENISPAQVQAVAGLTHAHEISQKACMLYIVIAKMIISGKSFRDFIESVTEYSDAYFYLNSIATLGRDEIKSTGYVADTLQAALWCLYHTHSYRDCVLTAVNLGEDTDTIAAVAGGLAGLVYGVGGEAGIPEDWIFQIARKEMIKDLCDDFERLPITYTEEGD